MTLPETLDPQMVSVAGAVMRHAVDQSHLSDLPDHEKLAVIERGVARIIAAGAFACDGVLFFPRTIKGRPQDA